MQSVQALVASIIDYAGLYPPAQLDPQRSVGTYAHIHDSKRQWMLGRLIWPVALLDDLSSLAVGQARDAVAPETQGAWAVSCVLSPAGTPEFAADLARVQAFNEQHEQVGSPAMRIDSIEMRASDAPSIERALSQLPDDIFPYFELSLESDVRGVVASLVGEEAGAKFRTGGTTPQAHPAAGDLARALHACASAGVPFKATAGLHRALCHFNHAAGATQFGFLNVFLGAAFMFGRKIDIEGLAHFLTVSSVDDIQFSEKTVMWQGARLSVEEIEESRSRFAHSFGCCSFDEPWDDLVAMEFVRAIPAGGAV
ncbi:MAG: hypothetical protein EXS01_06010 [Phycisphaerales bacterium]|nr:hypothetical protein [Phycisphaerales bacterium]